MTVAASRRARGAVIGGLLFATPTTLLVVPYLFATLRRRNDGKRAHGVFAEAI
jgi:multidrug efflux pump subunit AcrB